MDIPRYLPIWINQLLQDGSLVDLDKTYARANNLATIATCQYGKNSSTRIDGVLADRRTATLLTKVEPVSPTAIPGHRPVKYTLDLAGASQTVLKIKKLPKLSFPQRSKEAIDKIGREQQSKHLNGFCKAISNRDIETAWSLWIEMAESTLLALADGTPSVLCRGRGTKSMITKASLLPPKHNIQGGPKTKTLRDITACIGCL